MRALIFDFDGTLVDTELALYTGIRDYLKKGFDLEFSKAEYAKLVGKDNSDYESYMQKYVGPGLVLDELESHLEEYQRQVYKELPLRDGIDCLVEQALARGLCLGIATSSKYKEVACFLDHAPAGNALKGTI